MQHICLYFRIHLPIAIKKVSFFDLGNIPDLIDREKNFKNLEKRLHQVYLPAFSILNDLISKHRGDFQIALSVNGVLLEQISRFFPSHHKRIREFMKLEEIEMVTSNYFHSLASGASLDEFSIQVKLDKEKILETTGKQSVIFSNPDLSFQASMATILSNLQLKGILFWSQSEKQDYRKSVPFFYDHPRIKNIWLFPVDMRFSEAFRKGSLLSKSESERYLNKMVNEIHARGSSPVGILIDPDIPAESEISIRKRLDFLKRFIDRCQLKGRIDFRKPSQILEHQIRIQKHFIADMMTLDAGPMRKENILGKEAMRYIYSLEKRIKEKKDQNLLFQWRILQSCDYLQKINYTGPLLEGEFPGSEEGSTPHETYLDLMNALTALDIYTKK